MSEASASATQSTQDGNNTSDSTSDAGDGFKPITSQDDLNRIVTDRVGRERAKFSDYKDLKAKADQFDQAQQANQSAEERFNQRIADLERQNAEISTSATRSRIQAKFGMSDEDAAVFLTGADEETMTRAGERYASLVSDRKKQGNHVPREGTSPSTAGADSDERATARQLFGTG